MVIKFHGFSKLLKEKKLMDFQFYLTRSNLVSLQHDNKSQRILILWFYACQQP